MSLHLETIGDESDMLKYNIHNISKELGDLLIDNDSQKGLENVSFGLNQVCVCNSKTFTKDAIASAHQTLQCYHDLYQNQQQRVTPKLVSTSYIANELTLFHKNRVYASAVDHIQLMGSKLTTGLLTPPKFEFHFLRNQSLNDINSNMETMPPLLSHAVIVDDTLDYRYGSSCHTGSYRKKSLHKSHVAATTEEINYENIVVDLSILGLSLDGSEKNPVLRLFGLFKQMHFFLNDKLPSIDTNDVSYAYVNPMKSTMPRTMNVQYQVKQATRKCTIFLCDLQRILNANKSYDREQYMQCECSLNILRKSITQFEMYKRVELEHKRGEFVTKEACAQAERLELLIQQLNDQIRESHLMVHLFSWAMEKKNNKQLTIIYQLQQQQQQPQGEEQCEKSAILMPKQITPITGTGKNDGDDNDANENNINGQLYSTRRRLRREPRRYIG